MSEETGKPDVLKEVPELDLSDSIRDFAGTNAEYYAKTITKIQADTENIKFWNMAAALLGPVWSAARGLWSMFWLFTLGELVALVQIGKGIWGDLGAAKMAEAEKFTQRASELRIEAANGDNAATSLEIAENLESAAEIAIAEAQALGDNWWLYLLFGVTAFVVLRVVQGMYANRLYEMQYSRWLVNRSIPSGFNWNRLGYAIAILLFIVPLTLYRFTVSTPVSWTIDFPANKDYFTVSSNWLDGWFDRTADTGKEFFDAITLVAQTVLDTIELGLVDTPWPVVAVLLVLVAWRVASIRVAIFTAASLTYIGILGLWEASMVSIVMVGTASFFCILIGIPLGIWFAGNERAYTAARPVLDLMQTIPPFVYLIPIIAFFGTGKVPGVLATIIFAMPPVVRLTALGMRQVSPMVKEAATAFGATPRQILFGVELPLARPAIMTGVNQTILMSLSMVVIASLIGAKGLGQEVLVALQFVAKGQGILSGLAILFCAMMLDRIVQGRFQRQEER
ncbi:MAG: proline/glycine betaine ABC transporter permease [Gammaproteobacteria bacterium]|nr:proline/glycine betaine ABC transporter permease [Gammaproteobacteria bacterium]MCY4217988.1 proline/glycine betaine ABC transporter permease [Gammaproteobacteria bacterium]